MPDTVGTFIGRRRRGEGQGCGRKGGWVVVREGCDGSVFQGKPRRGRGSEKTCSRQGVSRRLGDNTARKWRHTQLTCSAIERPREGPSCRHPAVRRGPGGDSLRPKCPRATAQRAGRGPPQGGTGGCGGATLRRRGCLTCMRRPWRGRRRLHVAVAGGGGGEGGGGGYHPTPPLSSRSVGKTPQHGLCYGGGLASFVHLPRRDCHLDAISPILAPWMDFFVGSVMLDIAQLISSSRSYLDAVQCDMKSLLGGGHFLVSALI